MRSGDRVTIVGAGLAGALLVLAVGLLVRRRAAAAST